MTDEVISPLRRRMIEDMTIRTLVPKAQQGYIRCGRVCNQRRSASSKNIRAVPNGAWKLRARASHL
jgi:hypothetical protein